jgi:hypothetical protein
VPDPDGGLDVVRLQASVDQADLWLVGAQALSDGTLFIDDDLRGELWLGLGAGTQRRWVKVVLKNS